MKTDIFPYRKVHKKQHLYCAYLTIYRGQKLPPFYLGSTSIEKVENGYRGTITSKKYSTVWKKELKEHPDLFHTYVLRSTYKRRTALAIELFLQKRMNVIRSNFFTNQAFATKNGMFGRDVSGKNNPRFGSNTAMDPKTGESLGSIPKTDPRWKTGEIVFYNGWVGPQGPKTKKHRENMKKYHASCKMIKCKYCQKEYSKSGGAITHHEKYCDKNPNKESLFVYCEHCSKNIDNHTGQYNQHHGDNCKQKEKGK